MDNKLVTATINGDTLPVKFWESIPVVTLKDIDRFHDRPAGTARRNFNKNKSRFIEGRDYFSIPMRELRTKFVLNSLRGNPSNHVVLVTEFGYLMIAKSFTDDRAWDIQRELVENYFKLREISTIDFNENSSTSLSLLPSQEELTKNLGLAGKLLCQYEMVTRKQQEYISVLEKLVDAQTQRLEDIGTLAKTAAPRTKTTRKPSDTKNGYGIRAFAELCGSNMSTVGVWLESKSYMRRNDKGVLIPTDEYKDSEIFNKIPYAPGGCMVNVNYKLSESGAKKLARLFKKERGIA